MKWWRLFISIPRADVFAGQKRCGWYGRGLAAGVCMVLRYGATDGAGRQFDSGSSMLLPGMYRLTATIELATSEIWPRKAVSVPRN